MKKTHKGITIDISGEHAPNVLTELIGGGVPIFDSHPLNSGLDDTGSALRITAPITMEETVKAVALKYNATAKTIKREGFLYRVLSAINKRPGLVIGVLAFSLILAVLQNTILSIRCDGGEFKSQSVERELLRELEASSVRVLTPAKNSYEQLEIRLETRIKDLSWVNIERKGAVLTVKYRLLQKNADISPIQGGGDTPGNIVASRAGVITSIENYRGKALRGVGDGVHRGEVIVSGIVDGFEHKDPHTFQIVKEDTVMYVPANAKVIAKCVVEKDFFLPYVAPKTVKLLDKTKKINRLVIAGITIPPYTGLKDESSLYTSEYTARAELPLPIPPILSENKTAGMSAPKLFPLPFSINTTMAIPTADRLIAYSKEDVSNALKKAIENYKTEAIYDALRETVILDTNITEMPDENGITARAVFTIEENIATPKAIIKLTKA